MATATASRHGTHPSSSYDAVPEGATFVVEGGGRRLTTTFARGYPAAQVYAPREDGVICFEPMAAVTDARAISMTAVPRWKRHSACTASPSGPVTAGTVAHLTSSVVPESISHFQQRVVHPFLLFFQCDQ